MAANEYVQAAAAQLQSGATAIKGEIDQLRADFMNYEHQVAKEISNKEGDIRAANAHLATEQPSATDVALHLRVRHLQGEIEGLKKQLEDRRAQMQSQVRGKENAMNDLMNESRSLQNKAGGLK